MCKLTGTYQGRVYRKIFFDADAALTTYQHLCNTDADARIACHSLIAGVCLYRSW